AIVVPWYAMVYAQHGPQYLIEFFVGENVGRYADTYGQQARPFYFYLPVLLTELFPWSLFVPAALWAGYRLKTPLARLLLCWTAVIVLIFTFSSTKQDLYIFPIVAALAALVAGLLERAASALEPEQNAARWTWPVVVLLMLVFSVGMWRIFGNEGLPYYIRGAFAAGVCLVAGAIAVAIFWSRRRTLEAVIALGLSFVAVNYVPVLVGLPHFERFKPVAPLSAAALTRSPAAAVIQYRVALPSMVWYLGRPVEEVLDESVLQERLSRDVETLVLVEAATYQVVKDLSPTPTCIVDRRPLLDVKLRSVLDGTAMPEMLLVSNRCEGQRHQGE
ncbi:MAG: hypothetical protein M3Q55_05460, partial [Acidobacteriota bacterium]|nr:hypothetical protein [Acidobacteriota bacterium]